MKTTNRLNDHSNVATTQKKLESSQCQLIDYKLMISLFYEYVTSSQINYAFDITSSAN